MVGVVSNPSTSRPNSWFVLNMKGPSTRTIPSPRSHSQAASNRPRATSTSFTNSKKPKNPQPGSFSWYRWSTQAPMVPTASPSLKAMKYAAWALSQ